MKIQKNVLLKSILLLSVVLVPSLLPAQTNGLTLAEVRTKVLEGNPSVQEAVQRIAAAEAVLKQARSAYLPTVTLSGNYGLVDLSQHPDSMPAVRVSDSFKQGYGGLEANWLLFDGFAREARALGAKYGVQQRRELADETRRLLIQAATISFRQAQLARENMVTAEQDYKFNATLEEDARKRFTAGVVPESDVQNFSIRALQAESAFLQAKLDLKTAGTILAELMALPDSQLPEAMQPVTIAFETIPSVPVMQGELEYALTHRPDYKALKSGQLVLAQRVRMTKGELMPQVALVGDVGYTERSGFSTVSDHGNYDSFVGIAASWDLFTGGRKVNTVKEAQAQMRALEQQEESLRLSIRSTLQQRIDEAETSKAIFQRQEKIYNLTASVRDSVEKSYKAGVESITRLNEAQTDLTRAKVAYATSYIAYQLVLNQLDIDTGRILSDFK
ncbi:TolC family protein [Pontiellaceae bacterium B12219]|nr:TolC family protein [Pontiellaceae bacterium B12219]